MTIPQVVYDDDYAGDLELGCRLLLGLHEAGELNVIAGTSTWNTNRRNMAATFGYYGHPEIPMGASATYAFTLGGSTDLMPYYGQFTSIASNAATPTAINVLRQALSSAPDGSVVILAGGEMTNMQDLLNSPADGIDSRNGLALVTAKVNYLHWSSGEAAGTSGDANINHDATSKSAASFVMANWPVRIRLMSSNAGSGVLVGAQLATDARSSDVMRQRLKLQAISTYGAWLSLMSLYIARGLSWGGTTYFTETATGQNVINSSTGVQVFTPGAAPNLHTYLGNNLSNAAMVAMVEPLLARISPAASTLVPTMYFDGTDSAGPLTDKGSGSHSGVLSGSPLPVCQGDYYDFTGNTGTSEITVAAASDIEFDASHSSTLVAEENFPSISSVAAQNIAWKGRDTRPGYGLDMDTSGTGNVVFFEQSTSSTFSQAAQAKMAAGVWSLVWGTRDCVNAIRRCGERHGSSPVVNGAVSNYQADSVAAPITSVGGGALKIGADSFGTKSIDKKASIWIFPNALTWVDIDFLMWCPRKITLTATTIKLRFGLTAFTGPFTGTTAGWVATVAGVPITINSVSFSGQEITFACKAYGPGAVAIQYASGDTVDSAGTPVRLRNFKATATSTNPAIITSRPVQAVGIGAFVGFCWLLSVVSLALRRKDRPMRHHLYLALLGLLAIAALSPSGDTPLAVPPVLGASCGGKVSPDGVPLQCDLPASLQLKNVGGSDGAGLCVFTSIGHAARLQGVGVLADFQAWMRQFPGGGYPEKVKAKISELCREKGVPEPEYLQVQGSDLEILKLACKTGRMPSVTYSVSPTGRYGGQRIAHMVNLAHADDKSFAVLDNNYVPPETPEEREYEWMTPAEFSRSYAPGWAVILLDPAPPPFLKE